MQLSKDKKRLICIVSSTRADWGLLSPLARELSRHDGCKVNVIATNMHLSPRFGMTVNDIIADGFEPVRVCMECNDDSPCARVKAMSQCMKSIADAFERLSPDVVVILGDRYEMLAVASAAAVMRLPIVHIAGGAVSEGAFDDSIRHAITKLASIHLTETDEYRRRVIAMGEDPARVFNTGAIGVWNISNIDLLGRDELSRQLDFDLSRPYAVATFHPATLDSGDPATQCWAMLDALDRHDGLNIILTYPNNDPGSAAIIDEIEAYAVRRGDKVRLVRSLGLKKYLSALHYAEFSIGNSSSGIVEVASAGIPSIDIGIRQQGRAAARSVIHCSADTDDIDRAIGKALSPAFRKIAALKENPYFKPDTLRLMTDVIANTDLSTLGPKHFYDLPTC